MDGGGSGGGQGGDFRMEKDGKSTLWIKSYAITKGTIESITAGCFNKLICLVSQLEIVWTEIISGYYQTNTKRNFPRIHFREKTKKRYSHRSPTHSLSSNYSHLLCIFRPVRWPLFWCLQVSEECSMPRSSSVLLACLWLLSFYVM